MFSCFRDLQDERDPPVPLDVLLRTRADAENGSHISVTFEHTQDGRSGVLRANSPGPLRRRVFVGRFRLSPGLPEGPFPPMRFDHSRATLPVHYP
jgi:hypothetical protein